MSGDGAFHDVVAGHHYTHVDYLIAVAIHDDGYDVFADVVNVAFDCGDDHFAGRSTTCSLLFLLDIGGEPSHGVLHGSCAFHDLRQEHFAFSEEPAYLVHTVHERTVDDSDGRALLTHGVGQIGVHAVGLSLDEHALYALRSGERLVFDRFCRRSVSGTLGLDALGYFDETLGGVGATVEQSIVDGFTQVGRDFVDRDDGCGVDDSHIQAGFIGMV